MRGWKSSIKNWFSLMKAIVWSRRKWRTGWQSRMDSDFGSISSAFANTKTSRIYTAKWFQKLQNLKANWCVSMKPSIKIRQSFASSMSISWINVINWPYSSLISIVKIRLLIKVSRRSSYSKSIKPSRINKINWKKTISNSKIFRTIFRNKFSRRFANPLPICKVALTLISKAPKPMFKAPCKWHRIWKT